MAQRVPITIRLDSFEGPLDLLLYFIQNHALDISKVSIGKITDQYLAYVLLMQELNFDIASEFLVMAATLLHWKSRALLPQELKLEGQGNTLGEGELTQEDLVRQLLEHQRFLEAGQSIAQLPHLGADVFARANSKPPIEKIWKEMNISDLAMTYQDLFARARKRSQVLKKETVSVSDKIVQLADRLPLLEVVEFNSLMSEFASRPEVVATFLATLELGKLKKMKLFQEEVYSSIYVQLLETLENFEKKLASDFDMMIPQIASGIR